MAVVFLILAPYLIPYDIQQLMNEAKPRIFIPDNTFLRVFLMASKFLTYTHSCANI